MLLLLASCGESGGFIDDARSVPERALASDRESTAPLPAPAPVRLPYRTAYVENGEVAFRADPDGWDDRHARALGLGVQVRRRVERRVPADHES